MTKVKAKPEVQHKALSKVEAVNERQFNTAKVGTEGPPSLFPSKRFQLFAPDCLDSYKTCHRVEYPKGTQLVYSNFTARSLKHLPFDPSIIDNKIVWYGLQGTLKELHYLWQETFFDKPKEEVCARYAERVKAFTSDDKPVDVSHLEALHDLGYLPISVKALPEGSRVKAGVPLFTITNVRQDFYWLTNSLETYLSNEVWKATTVATIAYAYRTILTQAAKKTGSPMDFVPWQGHCFADRGMSGMMDAAKSCSGHLTSFYGSDSISSFDYLDWAYGTKGTFIGGSVPASEHSVMCIGGQDDEIETIRRLITEVHDTGIVSFVADSWDFWKVISEYLPALKDDILARKYNALGQSKVVVRPDSGDPADIICGLYIPEFDPSALSLDEVKEIMQGEIWGQEVDSTPWGEKGRPLVSAPFKYGDKVYRMTVSFSWMQNTEELYYFVESEKLESCVEDVLTSEEKGAIECLWEIFGGTTSETGYKILSDRIGLIYGDSITPVLCEEIVTRLEEKGFASCNVVLGVGSYTYNYLTRDSMGFAIKATYGVVNGTGHEMFKNPKTDNGTKKSARGLLRVDKEDGNFVLRDRVQWQDEAGGELVQVYHTGTFSHEQTLNDIRTCLWS